MTVPYYLRETPTYVTQNALLYRGFELHIEEPAWIADANASVQRRVSHLSAVQGWEREMVQNVVSNSDIVFGWHCDQRDEIDRLWDFIYRRRGMMEPVWVPSWKDDLVLAADVAAIDTTITVVTCGYTARMFPRESRRHLILFDPASNYVIRRVTASVDNGDGTETLTLESAVGVVALTRKTKICFLLIVRQASDTTEIVSKGINLALASIAFAEMPEELSIEPYTAIGSVSADPIVLDDVAWVAGFPVGVGSDSASFRWTAPAGAVEITIQTSATLGGTYTDLQPTFTDSAHVPNGEYLDTGSFTRGTTRYARIQALVNGALFYSTEEAVTWGSTDEVAPVITALAHVVVGVSVDHTHVEWTLASGTATAIKVYAQTVIFTGITPSLVATITNPPDIVAGAYDIPGSMAAVQLKAVYPDGGIIPGPITTV